MCLRSCYLQELCQKFVQCVNISLTGINLVPVLPNHSMNGSIPYNCYSDFLTSVSWIIEHHQERQMNWP